MPEAVLKSKGAAAKHQVLQQPLKFFCNNYRLFAQSSVAFSYPLVGTKFGGTNRTAGVEPVS